MDIRHRAIDLWGRLRPALVAFWMFIPIALIALAAAAYGWWWQQIADGIRLNAANFQNEQRALQRDVQWEALSVDGFPYKLEARVTSPRITAPDYHVAWDGDGVSLAMHPLSPNRATIYLEGHHHLFYVGGSRPIDADGEALSAAFRIADEGGSKEYGMDLDHLSGKTTVGTNQITFVADRVTANIRLVDEDAQTNLPQILLAGSLSNFALLKGSVALPLGPNIGKFEFDATLDLPEPVSELTPDIALAAWRNAGSPAKIEKLDLEWGGVTLSATGNLRLDPSARPEGALQLKIGNYQRLLDVMESSQLITPEARAGIAPLLSVLSFASGDPERRIAVPVTVKNGEVYVLFKRVATIGSLAPQTQPQTP